MNQSGSQPTKALRYPIVTKRLHLRPFEDKDLTTFHAMHSLEHVVRYLYWDVRSKDESTAALAKKKHLQQINKPGDTLALAVSWQSQFIGEVSFTLKPERQGEIGYIFHPDYSGRGLATEAALAMLDLGFRHYNCHRIIGCCDARNEASYKLLERLGFRREAHFREHQLFKGVWDEEYVYAILESEYYSLHRQQDAHETTHGL